MNLLTVAIITGVVALISGAIARAARITAEQASSEDYIAASTKMIAASMIRSISLLMTIGILALIGGLLAIENLGALSREAAELALGQLDSARSLLTDVNMLAAIGFIAIATIGMVIWVRRRSQRSLTAVMDRIKEEHIKGIIQQAENGELEELASTEEMQQVEEAMGEALQRAEMINEDPNLSDGEREPFIGQVKEYLEQLQMIHASLDMQRRIPPIKPDEFGSLPKPKNAIERFFSIFISAPLRRTLGPAGSVVAAILLLCLTVAAITASKPVADDHIEQVTVKLHDLRLEWSLDGTTDALSSSSVDEPATPDEFDELAAIFEEEAATAIDVLDVDNTPLRIVHAQLTASSVRDRILARSAQASAGRVHAASNAVDATHRKLTKRSDMQQRISNRLRAAAVENPELRARAAADVAQHRARLRSSNPALVTDVVGHSGSSNSSRYLARTVADRSGAMARSYIDGSDLAGAVETGRSTANLDPGHPHAAHLRQQLDDAVGNQHQRMRDGVRSLRDRPPTAIAAEADGMNPDRSSRAASNLQRRNPLQGGPTSRADALARFNDFFPGQRGADLATNRGKLLQTWNPSDSGTSRSGRGFTRARSFGRLRGFSRVGGVLIGWTPDDPAGNEAPFVTDFTWTIADGALSLVATTADGATHQSPAYPLTLAEQALAYAADGRPLAVTMTTADPMPFLKILTHPILRDTPMGHRVIELDRLVDTYFKSDIRAESITMATRLNLAYTLARYARVAALAHHMSSATGLTLNLDSRNYVNENANYANSVFRQVAVFEDENRDGIIKALDAWSGGEDWLIDMLDREAIYDETLVTRIRSTWTRTAGVRSALRLTTWMEAIKSSYEKPNILGSHQIERWLMHSPQMENWSGVRERSFDRATDELFPRNGNQCLEFMLQMAYTTPPAFGDEDEDVDPLVLKHLNDEIERSITVGIKDHPTHGEVVVDCGHFTVLQRFFRLALEGHLGSTFPLEKIDQLHEEVIKHGSPKVARTPRWNHHWRSEGILLNPLMTAMASAHSDDMNSDQQKFAQRGSAALANLRLTMLDDMQAKPAMARLQPIIPLLRRRLQLSKKFASAAEQALESGNHKRLEEIWTSHRATWSKWQKELHTACERLDIDNSSSKIDQAFLDYVDSAEIYWGELVVDEVGHSLMTELSTDLPKL